MQILEDKLAELEKARDEIREKAKAEHEEMKALTEELKPLQLRQAKLRQKITSIEGPDMPRLESAIKGLKAAISGQVTIQGNTRMLA